jgi:ribosome-associated protein
VRCYLKTIEIARKIIQVLEEKKGEDIVLLDIRGYAIFADYFVICSGTSDRMIQGLADGLAEEISNYCKLKPRLEGSAQVGWVLADFGDIVVHFFSPDRRNYYRLEELWSQGKVLVHLQ